MTPYIDITGAQTYFDDRLNTEAWDNATDEDKLKALKTATRSINNLHFIGEKADSAQDNEFPRRGQTDVPEEIQEATCEIALRLLDDIDPSTEMDAQSILNEYYREIRIFNRQDSTTVYMRNGIISSEAWIRLMPYLLDPQTIKLSR